MTDEKQKTDKLILDLAEVSKELAEWAVDQVHAGLTRQEILAKLRAAAKLSGRE